MRGQSSIEFVTLFTLVMLLFLGGLYFTGQKLVQIEEERIQKNSNAISNILQSEIELASKSEGNYSRLFSLPILFRHDDYEIDVYDNFELTIDYNNREYVYPLERSIIFFNVHPGDMNVVTHINKTVFIGDDTIITVNPSNVALGIPEGSTRTIEVTVASILGGLSAIIEILSEPAGSNLPPFIILDQTSFINFSTEIQFTKFGMYTFTVNGTTIFTPPGRLISPIQDYGEPYYWLNLLNLPPTYGASIFPAHNSVYEQPKNFNPRFYSSFYDENADIIDVFLNFTDSPIGSYIVTPVPEVPDMADAFPPVNYEFIFDQDVPLPDFGFYTFIFTAVDSQGLTANTPERTVELINMPPFVDGVYSEGTVPLIDITSWSDVLNFNDYHVEVDASDVNWNLKNITLVFTEFTDLDRPTSLQDIVIVVNNPALESTPDSVDNPGGESFRAIFNSDNGLIFDAYGQFFFKFVATDILGLTHESGVYQVNTYPPPNYDESSIRPVDGSIFERWEGFETDFNITFYDDSGFLNYADLEFTSKPSGSDITGAEFVFDFVFEYVFSVPKSLDKFGDYVYRFTGRNYLGGSNTTNLVHASLVNVYPIIHGVYETITYVNPPLSYFSDPYPARIPYDPDNILGIDGAPDIFFLYVTDINRNLKTVRLVQDSSPSGVPGETIDFDIPQDSGVYWPDFRDFLFTKFGGYSFHFEAEDEYGLTVNSQQFSLDLINEHPYFDDTYCSNGICRGDNTALGYSSTPSPTVLSSENVFTFDVKVYASDINWNLNNAIVKFTSGPAHSNMEYLFPDNQGSGYCSGGDNVFNLLFDSTGLSDPTDYGTYIFNIMLTDDEGLSTYSDDYTLILTNVDPGFTEICPYTEVTCANSVYNPAVALFILENIPEGDSYTVPLSVIASDVNYNLYKISVKITDEYGGIVIHNYVADPLNMLSNTFELEFTEIGDYNIEIIAYDQENAQVKHNFDIKLQNPPPEFTDSFAPGSGLNINWGYATTFQAYATDGADDITYISLIFTNGPADSEYASLGQTVTTGPASSLTFSKSVDFADFIFGTYTYHFQAGDSIGQLVNSASRTLTVVNQNPSISSVDFDPDPGGFNIALFPTTTVAVTVTDLSRNIVEVWVSGDASGTHTTGLPSANSVSNSFSVNPDIPVTFTNNGFGTYNLYINVKDSEDLTAQSGPYTFTFANAAPVISGSPDWSGILTRSVANSGYTFTATFTDVNSNLDRIVRSAIGGTTILAETHDPAGSSHASLTFTQPLTGFGAYCSDNCKTYSYTAYDSAGSWTSVDLSFSYVNDYPTLAVWCEDDIDSGLVYQSSRDCYVYKGSRDEYDSLGGTGGFDASGACDIVNPWSHDGSMFYSLTEETSSWCKYTFDFDYGCDGYKFNLRIIDNEGHYQDSAEYHVVLTGTEICDNKDNDCNDGIDEGCDSDFDNYCADSMTVIGTPDTCTASPAGSAMDCDDNNAGINPGATEICNDPGSDSQVDDNCDGSSDEGEGLPACIWYYEDYDNDGYTTSNSKCYCDPTGHYTETITSMSGSPGDDCRDVHYSVNPGQTTKFCDDRGDGSHDWNCDGSETKELTSTGSNPCGNSAGCSSTPHWNEGSVPACGVTKTKATACNDPAWDGCSYTTSEQCQKCI